MSIKPYTPVCVVVDRRSEPQHQSISAAFAERGRADARMKVGVHSGDNLNIYFWRGLTGHETDVIALPTRGLLVLFRLQAPAGLAAGSESERPRVLCKHSTDVPGLGSRVRRTPALAGVRPGDRGLLEPGPRW